MARTKKQEQRRLHRLEKAKRRAEKLEKKRERVCERCGCHGGKNNKITRHHIHFKCHYGNSGPYGILCTNCHREFHKLVPPFTKRSRSVYMSLFTRFVNEWQQDVSLSTVISLRPLFIPTVRWYNRCIMKNIQNFFRGKKTYFVASLMVILGLLQGDNQMVLEGLGLMTLRVGISSVKD